MIVAYEFNYLNENAMIAHFLLFYARKSALEFCLKKEASLISLFVRDGEDEILKFSDEAADSKLYIFGKILRARGGRGRRRSENAEI